MRSPLTWSVVAFLALVGTAVPTRRTVAQEAPAAQPAPPAPAAPKLVQPDDLVYEGAFRLGPKFVYGGGSLTYNPPHKTLLVIGHDNMQQVGEVAIPEIRKGPLASLATAALVRPLADILEGKRTTIDGNTSNGVKIGGMWPFTGPGEPGEERLAVTAYSYYDARGTQTLSHFVRPADLNVLGKVSGPFKTTAQRSGFVAGYFARIPTPFQAVFGGTVLNGLCCTPVIFRTSAGPSAWVINPADIGGPKAVPVTPLLYYPASPDNDHSLGHYATSNPYYNGTGQVAGAVFPEGTRSLLFVGTHGSGPYCYGPGTADMEKAGKPATDIGDTNDRWCFDPTSQYKGNHGYPYVYRVWAYDANDLAAVKTGKRKPWDPKPYAYWDLTFPTTARKTVVTGVGYDPENGRIFIGQGFAEGDSAVVHVFTIR